MHSSICMHMEAEKERKPYKPMDVNSDAGKSERNCIHGIEKVCIGNRKVCGQHGKKGRI